MRLFKPYRFFVLTILTISIFVAGCASKPFKQPGGTTSLQSLKDLRGSDPKKKEEQNQRSFRRLGLKETALSIGARAGLAARANEINMQLDKDQRNLDQTFNFSALLMDNNVVPPVLVESQNTLNQDAPYTLRLADKTYRIVEQARFATTPPQWREYIFMHFSPPETPHESLLPRTKEEIEMWDDFVTQGWKQGHDQADNIYADNLARLRRDYAGMVLYRNLLAQNMVSLPYVAKTDLGITGGGSEMRINDRVLRITALPSLQADAQTWRPVITPGN